LYCILKKSTSFILRTQKVGKKGDKKAAKKDGKKVGKKYTKKAHCHLHNTHANHQKKLLEPVLLLC